MAVFAPAAWMLSGLLSTMIFPALAAYIVYSAVVFAALFAWLLGNWFDRIRSVGVYRYPLAGTIGLAITALTFLCTVPSMVFLQSVFPLGPPAQSNTGLTKFDEWLVMSAIMLGGGSKITAPVLAPIGMVLGLVVFQVIQKREGKAAATATEGSAVAKFTNKQIAGLVFVLLAFVPLFGLVSSLFASLMFSGNAFGHLNLAFSKWNRTAIYFMWFVTALLLAIGIAIGWVRANSVTKKLVIVVVALSVIQAAGYLYWSKLIMAMLSLLPLFWVYRAYKNPSIAVSPQPAG